MALLELLLADFRSAYPGDVLGLEDEDEYVPTKRFEHREQWKATLRRDPCAYCTRRAGTVDHIVSKAATEVNGRIPIGTWLDYTGACKRCNGRKATERLLHFMLRSVSS